MRLEDLPRLRGAPLGPYFAMAFVPLTLMPAGAGFGCSFIVEAWRWKLLMIGGGALLSALLTLVLVRASWQAARRVARLREAWERGRRVSALVLAMGERGGVGRRKGPGFARVYQRMALELELSEPGQRRLRVEAIYALEEIRTLAPGCALTLALHPEDASLAVVAPLCPNLTTDAPFDPAWAPRSTGASGLP